MKPMYMDESLMGRRVRYVFCGVRFGLPAEPRTGRIVALRWHEHLTLGPEPQAYVLDDQHGLVIQRRLEGLTFLPVEGAAHVTFNSETFSAVPPEVAKEVFRNTDIWLGEGQPPKEPAE